MLLCNIGSDIELNFKTNVTDFQTAINSLTIVRNQRFSQDKIINT